MRRHRRNIDENENRPQREKTHSLDGAPGGAHPVDGVARDPHHGGEGHEEPDGSGGRRVRGAEGTRAEDDRLPPRGNRKSNKKVYFPYKGVIKARDKGS